MSVGSRAWMGVAAVLLLAGCATPPRSAPVPAAAPVRAAAAPAAGSAIDRAAILARLVPAGRIDPAGHPVMQPFVPSLALEIVIDQPPDRRPLDDADLSALGLDRAAALALGRANLGAGLQPIDAVTRHRPAPGEIGTIRGDFAESGRLLLHEQWGGLAAALGGTLYVSAPADDVILYSGGNPAALAAASRRLLAAAPNPLSDVVLRWTRQGWEVAIASHP